MEKAAYIFLAVTILATLTACVNSQNSSDSSTSSSTSSTASSTYTESLTTSTTSTENSSQPSEDNFPEKFTGYAGETLYGADAVLQMGNRLDFDGFTYVRWATPVFDSTLKTPDLINRDTYEMPKYDDIIKQKDPEWFVVKPGDVLENGLAVKSACTSFEELEIDGEKIICQTDAMVRFENTLTLTGVLYCQPEDDIYTTAGDLYFFADSTANSRIPVVNYGYEERDEYSLETFVFPEIAFVCDGFYYRIGNINSDGVDFSGIINRGGVCEVKVTLDNIILRSGGYGGGNGAYGSIVSIEKID